MAGIEEGETQADGDRLGLQRRQRLCNPLGLFRRQRLDDLAEGIAPLGDLHHAGARHHRLGPALAEAIEMGAHLVANLEHVAHAARHRHRDPRSVAREKGVGAHGEAVDEDVDLAGCDARAGRDAADAREHAVGPSGRRGHLVEMHLAGLVVDQHEIGEGAADIGR